MNLLSAVTQAIGDSMATREIAAPHRERCIFQGLCVDTVVLKLGQTRYTNLLAIVCGGGRENPMEIAHTKKRTTGLTKH